MIKLVIFLLFLPGFVIAQTLVNLEVIFQRDTSIIFNIVSKGDKVAMLTFSYENVINRSNFILWHNTVTLQTDSQNVIFNPQFATSYNLIDFGDSVYFISRFNNSHNLNISSAASASHIPLSRKLIPLDVQHTITGTINNGRGAIIIYGYVDSNYNNLGRGNYPFFIKYTPHTNQIDAYYQFNRGAFTGHGFPYTVYPLANGGYIMSCSGCKKYELMGFVSSNGYADIALLTENFEVLNDTAPLAQSYLGFPFALPRPRLDGPSRISGITQLANGDIVFLGLISDTAQQRFLNQDVLIARWDQQLNKIKQFQFGLPNATDNIFQFRHLVLGYDGFLYAAFETNSGDSLVQSSTERQKILVSKFDQQFNQIWQETYDSGSHMEFRDMIPTLKGVYLTATQRGFNAPYEKATLLRIKNSSPPVSVNKLNQKYAVDLYPNPATNTTFLNSTILLSGYQLYDMTGKLLVEKQVVAENRIEIDTEQLAPGLYIVQPLAAEAGKMMEVKRLLKY